MAVLCSEIWLLIGVVFVLQLPVIRSQLCRQGWTFHALTGSCMALIRENKGFNDAVSFCVEYPIRHNWHGDGHLVFIFDKATDDFVKGLLVEGHVDRAFIGLDDHANNGRLTWNWFTSAPPNYTGWADNSKIPDYIELGDDYDRPYDGRQPYVHKRVVMTKDGWQEYDMNSPAYFVCQVNIDFPTPRMVCPGAEVEQESPDITCTIETHPSFTITSLRYMKTAEVVASCDGRSCWSSQGYQKVVEVRKSQETSISASWSLKLRNVRISDATDWTCSVEFNNSGSWVASQPCILKVYNFPTPSMVCPVAEVGQESRNITCTVDTHPSFTNTSVRFMQPAAVVASCDVRSCWPSQGYQSVVDVRKSHETSSSVSWTLKLRNVTISDGTDWACSVMFNNNGSWVASQPCSLKVYTTPADIQCSHMFVERMARTTCTSAKVYPQVDCMWEVKYGTLQLHAYKQRSSNEVVSAEWYYTATCNASFYTNDAGIYVVAVAMTPSFGIDALKKISVSVAPPQQPPQLYLAGQRLESLWVEVVENQTLNITCRVPGGDPEVYRTIIKCNNTQQPFESDGSSVTMDVRVTRAFHGQNCTCSALHAASYTQTSSVEIRVTYPVTTDSKDGGSQAQYMAAIIGGIVAATVAIIIFGVLIFLWRKNGAPCKRKKGQHANTPMYAVFKNDKPGSRHKLEELPQAHAPENPQ